MKKDENFGKSVMYFGTGRGGRQLYRDGKTSRIINFITREVIDTCDKEKETEMVMKEIKNMLGELDLIGGHPSYLVDWKTQVHLDPS